ncbi:head GIN domain-containing protein [uncultured Algibacter sp.]|uniref:head GIN domain-containing protein n=1 Tax=uncultured Algibacter sp. TaxID=298659 RepID=UPI00262456D4|nr:head GIN domain-containing protein [uncultured Algibacter sp.]
MKKSITLTVLSLMLASITYAQSWGKKKIKGNGNVVTETRTTSDYKGIKCAGSMDFILVKGDEGNITLEGDSNLLEYIITEVKGDHLIVKTQKGVNMSYKNNTIKITIPFESVNTVSLAGSGDLYSRDTIETEKLSVSLAGSGDLKLDVKTNFIKGAIAGSGDLTLDGYTDKLEVKVAGSGDFHGFGLQANKTDVSVAGSGDAQVVSNNSLTARVAGSGDITYKGNPKKDTKVAGSGSINQR